MKWILIIFAIILSVSIVSASTPPIIYVDTDGSGDYNCDGTEDGVEINQALVFVRDNAGYDTVYLNGSNTYWINNTIIIIFDNTIFTGDSNAIVKMASNYNWMAHNGTIRGEDIDNVTIHGFELDGNAENNLAAPSYNRAFDFDNAYNLSIHDMHIHNFQGDGITLKEYDNPYIDINLNIYNNEIHHMGHDAIYITQASGINVYDNNISVNANAGVRFSSCNQSKIYDNIIASRGTSNGEDEGNYAIELQKTGFISPDIMDDIEIYNNTIYNLPSSGIRLMAYLDGGDYTTNDAKDVYIHHNIIYNCGGLHGANVRSAGIDIQGFNNTIIENNVLFNNTRDGVAYDEYYGGGVPVLDLYTILRNNIITNTIELSGYSGTGNGIHDYGANGTHTFVLEYNDVWNSTTNNYNGTSAGSNDIQLNPLFYNSINNNFHLNSTVETWNGTVWEIMTTNSPCIDTGKPTSDYSNEPVQNGGIINMGAYGNTVYASKSLLDITFIPPTLANNSTTNNNYIEINTSININNLISFVWNWNGTNITFFNDDYFLHMSFDNNSAIGENSTVVVDVSQYANNGSFENGVTGTWTTDGHDRGAMLFNGIDNMIECPYHSSFDTDNKLLLAGWIKPSNVSGHDRVLMYRAGGYYFQIDTTGVLEAYLADLSSPGYHKMTDVIPTNCYSFVGLRYNGSYVTLYLNDTYKSFATTGNIISPNVLRIGSDGGTRWYEGKMDEIKAGGIDFSHNDMLQLYHSDLYKYNSTQWYFASNQTNLSEGEYNYQIFANNIESDYRVVTYSTAITSSTMTILANSWGMFNNWTSTMTFAGIAANESNDICYTYYNVISGLWESYYVGYSWNSDYQLSKDASVIGYFDTQTDITSNIITPSSTELYTGWNMVALQGSSNKTISEIIADIGTNCSDSWYFNSSTGSYSNTTTHSIQPNQGFLAYITQNMTWTRSAM